MSGIEKRPTRVLMTLRCMIRAGREVVRTIPPFPLLVILMSLYRRCPGLRKGEGERFGGSSEWFSDIHDEDAVTRLSSRPHYLGHPGFLIKGFLISWCPRLRQHLDGEHAADRVEAYSLPTKRYQMGDSLRSEHSNVDSPFQLQSQPTRCRMASGNFCRSEPRLQLLSTTRHKQFGNGLIISGR